MYMKKQGFVYVMGNDRPTLYIGVTANLRRRVQQHKDLQIDGFTKKYSLTKLLYFEEYDCIEAAIEREKQLKNWKREWKLDLIKDMNPTLDDLSGSLLF